MAFGFDPTILNNIDPEIVGSGYTPYVGTGEEFASTVPVGGYADTTPMWAKRLAGFAAGFQNPSFGAQYLKDKEEERRRQAFLASQNQSSQQFELRKAAVRAADEMKQLERQAALQRGNQENAERVRTDEELRKQAADDARVASLVTSANLSKPERFTIPVGPVAGANVPVPLTTAEQTSRLQLTPLFAQQGAVNLARARTTAETEQGKMYAIHAKLYQALIDNNVADDAEVTLPMIRSFEEANGLQRGTFFGFKGMKIGQLKDLLRLAKPPQATGIPLFGAPGGAPTTAAPAVPLPRTID